MGLTVAAHPKLNALESSLLLQEAKRQLALMHSSVYQHRTHVDEAIGRSKGWDVDIPLDSNVKTSKGKLEINYSF